MNKPFYRAFEDKHRGSRELITSRLAVYLPFVESLAGIYPESCVVDLGCGRGEWLELLNSVGIPSLGVDLDAGMLAACKELGLNVTQDDALEFLKKIPDENVIVVSGFHIAEHLDFSILYELIKEIFRILKPGGLLILETPNPENITVGTCNFYMDPSHVKPIPPELLVFLPKYYGFARAKILRLQESPHLHDNSSNLALFDVLAGVSPDYSVVAQKSAAPAPLTMLDDMFGRQYGVTLSDLANRYQYQIDERAKALEEKTMALETKFVTERDTLHDQLRDERDMLHGEHDVLRGQHDALRDERDTLRGERDTLRGERDMLRGAHEAICGERDLLRDKQDALYGERDALRRECDLARGERDTLRGKYDALHDERDALRSERDLLRGAHDELRDERDALRDQRDTLHGERDALRGERDAQRRAHEALRSERDVLHDEREALCSELNSRIFHQTYLNQVLARQQADLQAILHSHSWQVTRPLRWLARQLRQLRSMPRRMARQILPVALLPLVSIVRRTPVLHKAAHAILNRMPRIKTRLRAICGSGVTMVQLTACEYVSNQYQKPGLPPDIDKIIEYIKIELLKK